MTISTGQFGGVFWHEPKDGGVDKEAFSRVAREEQQRANAVFPQVAAENHSTHVMHIPRSASKGGPSDKDIKVASTYRDPKYAEALRESISSRAEEYTIQDTDIKEVRAYNPHPEKEQWLQGMLFHPLTGTGIPGDPMQSAAGRERDVRDAFGFSFPAIEKSGIPRSLLGTQETNPTIKPLDRRRKTAAASYNPLENVMNLRDESDSSHVAESPIHELGHARDRERLLEATPTVKERYNAVSEGAADAFKDRFSAENIMEHESKFDPLLNPDRTYEIMEEPIRPSNGYLRLEGYGGGSHVWRNKMEQASYALTRMLGSLSPTGRTDYPNLKNDRFGSASRILSDKQLTAQQNIAPALYDINKSKVRLRGEVTHAQTLHIGEHYKNNPQAKKLLDDAGLSDVGAFAAKVHDLHLEEQTHTDWQNRRYGRAIANDINTNAAPERRSALVQDYLDNPNVSEQTKKTLLQPSLFENDPNWDPEPKVTSAEEIDATWMKQNKVKKPGARQPSMWKKMLRG